MNKANECTCPSGDGSLRHPCPAHPAVDQEDVAAKLTFINGRPAMCGCQVEYSDGGGEYSDVIYVTLCAKHSGSAILDLVATNRIALTPEYEGQWHADLYLDREIPLAKVEGATPAEAVLALMSAERIDPEQESVEQAGGDERAAFELFVRKHCGMPAHIAVNWDAKFTNDAWAGWQARAALAQPSPAGEYGDAYQGAREDIAIWKRRALEAEQALRQAHNGQTFMGEPLVQPYEAPREKVNALFKVLGFSGTASVGDILDAALERLQAQPSPAQAEQHWPKLEKPAQVGAIRFSAGVSSRLVVEAAQRLYEFESTPEKEAERIERLQAFREQCFEPLGTEFSKVLSENLVELSSDAKPEQAEAERPEGPTEDELEAAGLGYPLHKEEAVKLWYSGFRSEVITVLEAWEAIGHDIGMNPDKGELLDSLRYMLEKCEAHDAALARVAELERQQPVAWMHDQPNRVDVIHRDVKDLLQRVPGSSRGIHRPLDVSEHYTIPLYAAPVAQAQHSVPGKYDDVLLPFLKSMEHELHANAGKGDRPGWLQMDRRTALLEIYYHLAKLQKATKDNDAAGIVEYAADVANMSMMLVDVCGLLAAAPGKEGV
ncbi:hypothetical protein [Pseudomonas aeruginosa]|uniref:hypothetical protein n=1 Tax=Pseudomonas aeruginosa TaxID=287 RepID=UPI0021F0D126|nr:hypothetical protein [Pseudomonas aeruginosa]MCV6390659.1 hypothetical protein [Pseudomonas aeruginosa]